MAKRITGRLYYEEVIKYDRKEHRFYYEANDGYLYTGRRHRKTSLKPEDLPEHFVYGRYYKQFGYLATKGIVDVKYRPSRFSDHFLKDDCLMVSYSQPIQVKEEYKDADYIPLWEGYENVDEIIWGGDIVSVLQGAQKHSGYDIVPILEQIKEKLDWCIQEFGPEKYKGYDKWLGQLPIT